MRQVLFAMLPGALVLAIGVIGATAEYRVNLTASMPLGLWKRTEVTGASYVAFCLPNGEFARIVRARGYVPYGTCPDGLAPLLKPVAARAGDVVSVTPEGFVIYGQAFAQSMVRFPTLGRDTQGRPLRPIPWGDYPVAPGSVWVLSTSHPRSLDSRYFGPVPATNVISGMKPVLVWDDHLLDAHQLN